MCAVRPACPKAGLLAALPVCHQPPVLRQPAACGHHPAHLWRAAQANPKPQAGPGPASGAQPGAAPSCVCTSERGRWRHRVARPAGATVACQSRHRCAAPGGKGARTSIDGWIGHLVRQAAGLWTTARAQGSEEGPRQRGGGVQRGSPLNRVAARCSDPAARAGCAPGVKVQVGGGEGQR